VRILSDSKKLEEPGKNAEEEGVLAAAGELLRDKG
jgi:hypothetical protein